MSATKLTDYVFHCYPSDISGDILIQDDISESFVDAINNVKIVDGNIKFYIEWDEQNEI